MENLTASPISAACQISVALTALAVVLLAIALWRRVSERSTTAFDAAMAAGSWAGRRLPGPPTVFAPLAEADELGRGEPDALYEVSTLLGTQFRYHAARGSLPEQLPARVRATLLVLSAAMGSPHRVPPLASAILARAHAMRDVPSRGDRRLLERISARPKAMPPLDWAMNGHAWWETVALELMAHARSRGSWLAADDFRYLQAEEPALFAALCSAESGATSPEGAALVGHWKAELAAGIRLDIPRVDEGLSAVCGAAVYRG